MKEKRFAFAVTTIFLIGGVWLASSTFADTYVYKNKNLPRNSAQKYTYTTKNNQNRHNYKYNAYNATAIYNKKNKIELVPPPATLPQINQNLNASLKPVVTNRINRKLTVYKIKNNITKHVANNTDNNKNYYKAHNPQKLFTLTRLLNYAPHPLTEDILKKKPIRLGQNKYWFTIGYDEDWKVVNDEKGYLKAISFKINVLQNNKIVRSLKTPKVKLNPYKLKKGQVLGIAEVAPYKFTITVDNYKKTRKGITELVFKLDLVG